MCTIKYLFSANEKFICESESFCCWAHKILLQVKLWAFCLLHLIHLFFYVWKFSELFVVLYSFCINCVFFMWRICLNGCFANKIVDQQKRYNFANSPIRDATKLKFCNYIVHSFRVPGVSISISISASTVMTLLNFFSGKISHLRKKHVNIFPYEIL